ncbi:substrate-binding periplasmic protein [Suttonella ornithocola]|nr:transporter substrate-binding domain-containing protein [Suttonella ornithocola]
MGANISSPPFIFRDDESKLTGFEIELINEIGKQEGFDVRVTPAIFPFVFTQLEKGDIDFIGNLYYSEERNNAYLLSQPYYTETLQYAALGDKKIENPLMDGSRVSVLASSPVEEILHEELPKYPGVKLVSEETSYLGFKDLFIKKVDFMISTQSNIASLTNAYPQYEYQTFTPEGALNKTVTLHFLTLKSNSKLMERINQGLNKLIENGKFDELKAKYHLK